MENDNDDARIQGAHELGLVFVRSMILLNGGAFAVLLGYAASSNTDTLVKFSLQGLQCAMTNFLLGISSVLLSIVVSYIYTALNYQSSIRHWLDGKVIPINVILCLISLCAFAYGVLSLIWTATAT